MWENHAGPGIKRDTQTIYCETVIFSLSDGGYSTIPPLAAAPGSGLQGRRRGGVLGSGPTASTCGTCGNRANQVTLSEWSLK